jgi:hypothetical protein
MEKTLMEAKQLSQTYQGTINNSEQSSTLKNVANFDTLEKLQNENKDKADTSNVEKGSIQVKLGELQAAHEGVSKKISIISNKVSDIIKCLCSMCNSSTEEPNNDSSLILCKSCNAIFCEKCLKCNRCSKCQANICYEHSIKCHLCERRVCNNDKCRNEFIACPNCSISFCQEHYNTHKEFNQKEKYHLKCTSSSYHVSQPQNLNSYIELANVCLLKELKICTCFSRFERYKY